ncbi:MAG: hypothetical protein IT239_03750, partial [Bacteroidia bacterium]|nr:hypothetical protein [Bacteroidia bacterium]
MRYLYKRIKNLILFILLLSLTIKSYGQGVKTFTTDVVKFPDELKDFFEADDKKAGREFGNNFIAFWNANKLNEKEKLEIILTCNTYLKKRLKAFPDFKNYLQSYQSFKESSQPQNSFDAWKKSLDFFLNGKVFRKFPDFLETSNNLLSNGVIYTS